MFQRIFYLIILLTSFTASQIFGQAVSVNGYPGNSNCVGALNVYYLTGATPTAWSVTGTYTNLYIPADKSYVQFNWSGAYTNARVTASYSGGSASTAYFNVAAAVTPSVSISPTSVSVNYGTNVTFIASPVNGGTPAYQWFLNGTAVAGQTGVQYSNNALQNGDQVYVRMTSNVACASPAIVSSSTTTANITYPISSPTVSNVTIPFNTSTTLSASGAGTNEVYRWYTTPSLGSYQQGTSFTTPVLTDHTTYYVSKYNTVTTGESGRVAQVVTLTLAPPAVPAFSTNTCGSKTITIGTPPTNVAWYWQGTDPNGTSTNASTQYAIDDPNNQTYYVRAKATTANIWSTATGFTVNSNPVDITLNAYQSVNPLVQATSSIRLTAGFYVTQGNAFNGRIAITGECNDYVNWSEQLAYGQDGSVISRGRSYSDALGRPLQTQWIDYAAKKVFATQPLYGYGASAVGQTLPAPIREQDFIYKNKFASNLSGTTYGATDFDKPVATAAAGELNNPNPMGTQPGTVGWYYSSSNNLEAMTPTTSYPYSRAYVPEGPDPTTSKSAAPGDAFKMGSGHESVSERQLIAAGELDHYYALSQYFVKTPPAYGSNLLAALSTSSTTGFAASQNVTIASAGGYLNVTNNQATSTPGVYPMGGTITVVPGQRYVFSVKGYCSNASSNPSLYVNSVTNGDLVWPGPVLPAGAASEDWTTVQFVAPAGTTQVRVGVLWSSPVIGHSISLSAVELRSAIPTLLGYKSISTDPNDPNKKVVSFSSGDGKALASALLTGSTYSDWSYTYYNDLGQVVASVAPQGVNTASTAMPTYVTYFKYDHLGRMIETTSPDEGTSRFVYNTEGAIRFSQNQLQRDASPNRFSYTNYDYLGRLIESGEFTSGGFIFEPHTTLTPSGNSVLNIIDVIGQATGISNKIAGQSGYITDYSYVDYDVQASDFPDASTASQTYVNGQVARTENANAITWYSYDEFGQVIKTWQKFKITSPAVVKTIEYTYDYLGNVTEVAYQKSDANDRFYHHYAYDINQRLITVHTSRDGSTRKLQATYSYYLHGPLKRVVLGDNVQGIDYVYNIDGSLKSINHADNAKDPGNDGNDAFGMTLQYYDNDYQGAAYATGSQVVGGVNNQYGGALKSISWHSAEDNHQKRTYAYSYDNKYQLTNAIFGDMTGSGGSYGFSPGANEVYREGVPAYDKNGNILSLIRKGKVNPLNSTVNSLANYSYVYEPNTNRLDKVNNNGSLLIDYTYNSIGQMVQQTEGSKTFKISYNAYGLTKEVRDVSNVLVQSYSYDDRGDLLQRITYTNGTPTKYTTYANDLGGNALAIYEQSVTTLASVPLEVPVYGAGRVGVYKPQAANNYFYEVTDHLGNVRAVIGGPSTMTVTATMETANQATEQNQFLRYDRVRIVNAAIFDHTNQGATQNSIRLSGSANEKTGLARSFAVSPGDVVKLEVYAKYVDNDRTGVTTALNNLVNGIVAGTAPAGTVVDGANYSSNASNPFPYAGLLATSSPNGPKAYLNYLFFDTNFAFNLSKSGYVAVSTAANETGSDIAHEYLSATLNITEPGYIYAYLSNDAPTPIEVYFDDFTVTHNQSNVVAGADYYPYGLPMEGRKISDEPYRWGYQGQYAEENATTGVNEFELRMYDARFGRWLSPDPYGQFSSPYIGMGNTPNMGVDPDGGLIIDPLVLYTITENISKMIDILKLTSGSKVLNEVVIMSGRKNPSSFVKTLNQMGNGLMNRFRDASVILYGFNRSILGDWVPKVGGNDEYDVNLRTQGAIVGYALQLWASSRPGMPLSPRGGSVPVTPTGQVVPLTKPVAVPIIKTTTVNAKSFPKEFDRELEKIKSGKGTPRLNDNGTQKVFQGRELSGGQKWKWQGALEWDVPGTSHRILQKINSDGSSTFGRVINHDYSVIYPF